MTHTLPTTQFNKKHMSNSPASSLPDDIERLKQTDTFHNHLKTVYVDQQLDNVPVYIRRATQNHHNAPQHPHITARHTDAPTPRIP